jgi:CheY-like chemotaxis protein
MNNKLARILVVDDDRGMRVTLEAIIEDEGYDVVAVADGYRAIEAARDSFFDLIFMDIKMPGIDGVAAYREIKKASPRSVVVMMTGFAVENLVKEALQEGVYGVLYKPFSMEQIIDIIQGVLKSTGILVVDDLESHRKTLRAILEETGYEVSEAEDGRHAIAIAAGKHHDIILMDVVMPGMNGLETFEEIRKIDMDVKVIFVSGYSLDESVRNALRESAYSVLAKPVNPSNLLTLIGSVIGRRTAPAPAA